MISQVLLSGKFKENLPFKFRDNRLSSNFVPFGTNGTKSPTQVLLSIKSAVTFM